MEPESQLLKELYSVTDAVSQIHTFHPSALWISWESECINSASLCSCFY